MALTSRLLLLSGLLTVVAVGYYGSFVDGKVGSKDIFICLSNKNASDCIGHCNATNANCSMLCSNPACTMKCDASTYSCDQACGGASCLTGICHAKSSCKQTCQASGHCPTMECHSPGTCTFRVPFLGGLDNRFVCHKNTSACNLECKNSNCSMTAYGQTGNIDCKNSNCTIKFMHRNVNANIVCDASSRCLIMMPDTSAFTCNGGCSLSTSINLPAVNPNVGCPSSGSMIRSSLYILLITVVSLSLLFV